MSFRQGNRFILVLESYNNQDEFLTIFRKNFTYEYDMWLTGRYKLLLWEHLIYLAMKEEIQLNFLHSTITPKEQPYQPNFSHFDAHEVPLSSAVEITLIPHKPKRSLQFWTKTISTIEIDANDHGNYYIYLNEEYNHPIVMSNRTKSGKLWYHLANDGFAPFADFRSTYDYIQSDKRFKFFAKTKYAFRKLLDRDEDGYIIPAEGIRVKLR